MVERLLPSPNPPPYSYVSRSRLLLLTALALGHLVATVYLGSLALTYYARAVTNADAAVFYRSLGLVLLERLEVCEGKIGAGRE